MKKELENKTKYFYCFDEQDLKNLDLKKYAFISLAGILAGFISGMLGAGAGLIIVPILLYLNIHSRVTAATSGFMYFFISFTAIF